MTGPTHLALGVSTVWLLRVIPGAVGPLSVQDGSSPGLLVGCAALGVLLPDLDATRSTVKYLRLGRRFQPFLWPARIRPAARLLLTSTLRTSGLWSALPPDELRDLTLMLTFLSPNGRVQPTLPELAGAMQSSHKQTRARMLRLSQRVWRGQPLVMELNRQSGLDTYLPGRHLLGSRREQETPAAAAQTVLTEPRAGRDVLIAHSRARYAAPRAEVEADIARRMGWGAPAFEDDLPEVAEEKRALYDKLSEQGMSKSQALEVLNRFDLAVVRRQCDWMPYRAAKNPSRYLQAAIENDYEAPVAVRQASMKGVGATADDQ